MQKEVMQVMVAHRKRGEQVYLGQNAVHKGQGKIEVGQPVTVIQTKKCLEQFYFIPTITGFPFFIFIEMVPINFQRILDAVSS